VARQLFWVGFTSLPFPGQIPLKRATTRIARVNILVRRQVDGPSSVNGNLQRRLAIHSPNSKGLRLKFNPAAKKKLLLFPETRSWNLPIAPRG
jgi:hypothetical protein